MKGGRRRKKTKRSKKGLEDGELPDLNVEGSSRNTSKYVLLWSTDA
jgi:hypothetical protein